MTHVYAADEMVDLLAVRRPFDDPELVAVRVDTMPLDQATATVVETWAGDEFRQMNAVIRRRSGPSIRSFEEIKRLYQLNFGSVGHLLKLGLISFGLFL
ncbi:hypothetical protein [Microvirga yunnanensis]|uniref:hypothetical protein n=1 Tax=Microvirga yunnanensis TaxID=2953740 RepID=UPI0021C71D5A|nr:hypothetical protein [Microvirga sp. HBU65207]